MPKNLDSASRLTHVAPRLSRHLHRRSTRIFTVSHTAWTTVGLFRTAANMREVAVRVLKENPKIANPYPNVDAVSGTLLNASGLTDSDYYTLLFGWSRVVGITAQIVDERLKFRNGKGVAIYRCKFIAENQG